MRVVMIACVLLLGCARPRAAKVYYPGDPIEAEQPATTGKTTETPATRVQDDPKRDPDLYGLDEALADVQSGPLRHVGSGPWFGLSRRNVCAYRNEKVIVVNIYCNTDRQAVSIIVMSPVRGRVVIYAEAEKAIAGLKRAKYVTFKGESQPVSDKLPAVSLGWNLAQLSAWEQRRDKAYLPSCYGGIEWRKPEGGCSEALVRFEDSWRRRNQPFLDNASQAWYRVSDDLRARARQDAKPFASP
jgi:hypothetical protein